MKEASKLLLDACEIGDVELVRLAIKMGADVNVFEGGWFPLYYASNLFWGNSIDIVRELKSADCNMDQQCGGIGPSALSAAVRQGNIAMIQELLKLGANPNVADISRCTPCYEVPSAEILTLLLNYGADLRVRNCRGTTPFQFRDTVFGGNASDLRPICESWTPHRMLPRWNLSAFSLFCEECPGFRDAIQTFLLCLLRYRHIIPKEIGLEIVEYIAESHRRDMWWPAWENFDMQVYM